MPNKKSLEELNEILSRLNQDGINYIVHIAKEMKKDNDKYLNMTKEEISKDFDEWKANRKATDEDYTFIKFTYA